MEELDIFSFDFPCDLGASSGKGATLGVVIGIVDRAGSSGSAVFVIFGIRGFVSSGSLCRCCCCYSLGLGISL